MAGLLRPGNAGSNTAADHVTTTKLALAQLPKPCRRGRRTLIRTDSAGGTHDFLNWLTAPGRWLSYSVGMTITDAVHHAVLQVPGSAWTPAVEPDGQVRAGARVAELAGDILKGWPVGMRLIVRKERPHPGAQLRFTDADGMRLTCFATDTADSVIARLELRHRRRAHAEDRIRAARDTGLRDLPLHDAAQNQVWLEIAQIAMDLLAWMPMLALTGTARWEPKRLRLRLFFAAARLVTTSRRRILRLARHWPWTDVITSAFSRLRALPNPRLSRSNDHPNEQNHLPEPWNPTPTRRDSRAISTPTNAPANRNGRPDEPTDRHEGSRLKEGYDFAISAIQVQ